MKHFEFLEHTADIIVKGTGDTPEEAFEAAAEGMFSVISDINKVEAKDKKEFKVESIDREGLLVAFLSRLIYLHEVDHFVIKQCSVSFQSENMLKAVVRGEKFDDSRHEHGMHVKAVSYHMLEIVNGKSGEPSYVQVLIDV